jgi:hypothetical protein
MLAGAGRRRVLAKVPIWDQSTVCEQMLRALRLAAPSRRGVMSADGKAQDVFNKIMQFSNTLAFIGLVLGK